MPRTRLQRRQPIAVSSDSEEDEQAKDYDGRMLRSRASGRGESARGSVPVRAPSAARKRTLGGNTNASAKRRRNAAEPSSPEVQILSPPSQHTRSRLPSKQAAPARSSLCDRCHAEIPGLKTAYGEDEEHGVKVENHGANGTTSISFSVCPVLDPQMRSFSLHLVASRNREPEVIRNLKYLPPIRMRVEFSANTVRVGVHCFWMNKDNLKRLRTELNKALKSHNGDKPILAAAQRLQANGLKDSGVLVNRRISYAKSDIPNPPAGHLRYADLDLLRNLFTKVNIHRKSLEKYPALKKCSAFDCAICFDHKSVMNAAVFGCEHHFCKDCLNTDFSLKIKENRLPDLVCLSDGCTTAIPVETVKAVVDRETFQRYCDLKTDNFVASPSFVRCPKKNCNVPMELAEDGPRDVKCPSCRHKFCSICKAKPHPDSSCLTDAQKKEIRDKYNKADARGKREMEQQYGKDAIKFALEDAESQDWIDKNAKPCPKCKTPIQKIDGCNKITCKAKGCNTYFCWLCGQALTGANPYQHFNEGACANRLHEGVDVGEGIDIGAMLFGFDDGEDFDDDSDSDDDDPMGLPLQHFPMGFQGPPVFPMFGGVHVFHFNGPPGPAPMPIHDPLYFYPRNIDVGDESDSDDEEDFGGEDFGGDDIEEFPHFHDYLGEDPFDSSDDDDFY